MPITKQAIKKLRHDRVRSVQVSKIKASLRALIKSVRQKPTATSLSLAYRALDKATKTHVIHKNKSARLKSRLSKLLKK